MTKLKPVLKEHVRQKGDLDVQIQWLGHDLEQLASNEICFPRHYLECVYITNNFGDQKSKDQM